MIPLVMSRFLSFVEFETWAEFLARYLVFKRTVLSAAAPLANIFVQEFFS
jgi:hypothetical protein